MIEWTGRNLGKFRRALLAQYVANRKLRRLVTDNLDYCLDNLSDPRLANREDWTEDLLGLAVEEGWIEELYVLFCSVHQNNPRIVQLKSDLRDPSLSGTIGESFARNVVVRSEVESELVEDARSTHLVIAAFWHECNNEKLSIRPKFCYRNAHNSEISFKNLLEDNCSVDLKKFPDFLEKLVAYTIEQVIPNILPDSPDPWSLTIELFVPVNLLGKPLATWCGKNSDISSDFPIVVGCSDRFDPFRPSEARILHNQLKRGWRRFQDKLLDGEDSRLTNLDWLNSCLADQEILEAYSGFKCYGDWLKPDENCLKNWVKLVKSGIPLALWMCEGRLDRTQAEASFHRLTNVTRFEFLEHMRINRRNNSCCVSVLYENPNYVPDDPLPQDARLFEWPGT
jgi:vWA-MoxR associated protein C-terminal domain